MDWLRRLPLRYKVASVGTLVLVVMVLAVALVAMNVRELSDVQKQQVQAQSVTALTGRLYGAMVDMQTGVRGYVISRDQSFLEPYLNGNAVVPVYLDQLAALLEGRPEQVTRLAQLRTMITNYEKGVLEPQIERTEAGHSSLQLVFSGQLQMDQIKAVLNEIQTTQASETEQLAERVALATRRTWLITLGFVGGAAALSLLFSFWVAASVTRPIQRLMAAADTVAKGGAGHVVAVTTSDEVGRLTESFNEMSRSLLEQLEENTAQQEELQAQQEELHAQNEELHAQQETLAATLDQLAQDRTRLESLNHFSRIVVGAHNLQELTGALLTELLAAGRAEVGSVMLLQEDGELRVTASRGLTREALTANRTAGFVAQVAQTGESLALRYPEGALLRPIYHTELPVEHELYVPIRVADQTIAVAALGRTGPAPFQPMEMQWVSLLAAQAGAALSNRVAYETLSRTYGELKQHAELIGRLNAIVEQERDRARSQADNLNAVLGTTSEGFWLVDDTGRTLLVNNRFWELTGFAPNADLTFADFVAQVRPRLKSVDPVRLTTNQLLASPDLVATDLIEFAAPREQVLQRFSAPVTGADGRRIGRLFVLRDVTRETEVDRMKTEFISTVSHELRTPLTSIRGFVDLILDGDAGPITDDQREFLELVSRSTVRLANLINDLLDVEKIESGRIELRHEPVDVAQILRHVTKTFAVSSQEKGLNLQLEIQGPLPLLNGDADRLTQVFTNLVSNAVKYTKAGGIAVSARVEGQNLVVAVADTGIGLAKESIQQLFTKFFRVDNEYTREVGGAGLGLAITRAIVNHHHGDIDVYSELGKGSTFIVSLPLSESQAPRRAPTAQVPTNGSRVVLIIEDDADIARLIAQHVGRLGLHTVVAASGTEGLALAKTLRPDLITLDVMLPGMDGWEVISHLKRDPITAKIPVLFLSILEETQKGFRLGADAYLTKPLDLPVLSSTLERLLDRDAATALIAVGRDGDAEVNSALAQNGYKTVIADPEQDLPPQLTASDADLLLIETDWNGTPLEEHIRSVRHTAGFEDLLVVVLTGARAAPNPLIEILGARTVSGEIGPEAIATEIRRHLIEHD